MRDYDNQIKVETPFGIRECWVWLRWYLATIFLGALYLPILCLRSLPYVLLKCPMFVTFWFCLGADFYLKEFFKELLANGYSVEIIKGCLTFTLVHNKGAAFGLLQGFSWLFILMAVVTGTFILLYLSIYHQEDRRICWALVMILSGAIGNMIDRVLYGYVIDYVLVYYGDWSWPVFNFADVAINIGVGLILIDMFLEFRNRKPEQEES